MTSHAQEDEPLPDIAWTVNGELWLASADMEPVRYSGFGACCAIFSQGGTRLAFITNLVSDNEADSQLMVLDLANPAQPRRIASDALPEDGSVIFVRWGDENTLFFNMLLPSERDDAQLLTLALPLWRVDVESGEVTPFPADGVAFPNRRGDLIAVVDPGIYDETPMTVTLLRADGEILSSHQHPAVSSASHLDWIAELHWLSPQDGLLEGVGYALPDPDLAYPDFGELPPPTQLYEAFYQGGDPVLRDEIITPFPATVAWSPDGVQIAYLSPVDDAMQQDVMVLTITPGALSVTEAEPIVALEDLSIGVSLRDWREELAVHDPQRGLLLWKSDSLVEIPDVLAVTAHASGGWVLLKADGTISLYRDDTEQIIARGVPGFGVMLASTSP